MTESLFEESQENVLKSHGDIIFLTMKHIFPKCITKQSDILFLRFFVIPNTLNNDSE